jgi:hypothetical protein
MGERPWEHPWQYFSFALNGGRRRMPKRTTPNTDRTRVDSLPHVDSFHDSLSSQKEEMTVQMPSVLEKSMERNVRPFIDLIDTLRALRIERDIPIPQVNGLERT